MPSNVFNENGEQTHVILQLDEYNRMAAAVERLSSIRQFAQGMLEQVGDLPEDPKDETESVGSEGYDAHR